MTSVAIFDSHMHVGSFESMFRVSLDRDGMVELMRENEIENGVVFHPDNAYVAGVVESVGACRQRRGAISADDSVLFAPAAGRVGDE